MKLVVFKAVFAFVLNKVIQSITERMFGIDEPDWKGSGKLGFPWVLTTMSGSYVVHKLLLVFLFMAS